jgi:type IV pilus assembly protein PilB
MPDSPSLSSHPSISSENIKKSKKEESSAPKLKISTSDVDEKFKEKMTAVSLKEKEIDTQRKAARMGYPHIDLEKFPVSQQALKMFKKEDAQKLKAVVFYYAEGQVRVGAVEPDNKAVHQMLKKINEDFDVEGSIYIISEHSFERVLKMYDRLPVVLDVSKNVSLKEEDIERLNIDVSDFSVLQDMIEKTSTTDLFAFLLGAALKIGASDLHVEAEEKGISVRIRFDGILHEIAQLEKDKFNKLLARIKLISSLKINITTKPQDGRFTIILKNGSVDVRVSTMPTVYGESVVMRLLPQKKEGLTLENIGLYGDGYEKIKKEIERPNGMILATGPTGSGKTTTLYSILHLLNKPGVKIITLEDPVEYRMKGINQSQINISRDYTFAKGLRSILRQDPDICMVGEVRDLETAEIAVQSALTGHLILSTLHTNSASATVLRLLSMGVKPFLLAPALNTVIGQRLVRILCKKCKEEAPLESDQKEEVEKIIQEMPEKKRKEVEGKKMVFYKAVGCKECHGIGFKGRTGLYELLTMSDNMERLVLSGELSELEVEKLAVQEGMLTILQDGILKALEGVTSVEEVFRVTG